MLTIHNKVQDTRANLQTTVQIIDDVCSLVFLCLIIGFSLASHGAFSILARLAENFSRLRHSIAKTAIGRFRFPLICRLVAILVFMQQ